MKIKKPVLTHLSTFERLFIRELSLHGHTQSQIQEIIFSVFGRFVSVPTISKTRNMDLSDLTDQERSLLPQVQKAIQDAAQKSIDVFNNEMDQIRTIRKASDMTIGERVLEKSVETPELIKISKDFFERERVLAGLPSSISEEIHSITDEELINELKNVEVRKQYYSDGAGTNLISGTEEKTEGGTDKVLESSSPATEVSDEQGED